MIFAVCSVGRPNAAQPSQFRDIIVLPWHLRLYGSDCYAKTNLLTYLLCSPPGTAAHLGGGTGAVPPPEEDRRTPPKLPKLEHVVLNSASETGAKMHQNAQICKLNFKIFLGTIPPDPHTGEGLQRPSPDPTPSARRFAPTTPPSGPSAPPSSPTRNPGSTPERTHPLKILATPMRANNLP